MRTDRVEAVGIDENGSLWVQPATETFPQIYQEGTGVQWDSVRLCFYRPRPREWSYLDWFKRIKDGAREQGVKLQIDQMTLWIKVDPDLQAAIVSDDKSQITT